MDNVLWCCFYERTKCPVIYIKNWTIVFPFCKLKPMKTTEYVSFKIDRLPRGYVFTHEDFNGGVNKREAIIKALNRMASSGKIVKLSKGKYYKPEVTPFGELQPPQKQIVKDLLEDNGKVTGYLTGYSVFNELGLTTQVSNTIQIGRNWVGPEITRGKYTIRFVRQKNTITVESVPLLQLLDVLRFIKKVPDTTPAQSVKRLQKLISNLSKDDLRTMVRLAQKYPPSTRALLGAIFDDSGITEYAQSLRASLNPITTYKIPDVSKVLPSANSWNIL